MSAPNWADELTLNELKKTMLVFDTTDNIKLIKKSLSVAYKENMRIVSDNFTRKPELVLSERMTVYLRRLGYTKIDFIIKLMIRRRSRLFKRKNLTLFNKSVDRLMTLRDGGVVAPIPYNPDLADYEDESEDADDESDSDESEFDEFDFDESNESDVVDDDVEDPDYDDDESDNDLDAYDDESDDDLDAYDDESDNDLDAYDDESDDDLDAYDDESDNEDEPKGPDVTEIHQWI